VHVLLTVTLRPASYCVVEWDEPGSPRNVVPRKDITSGSEDPGDVAVGKMCEVQVREGNRKATYRARVLGIGKI